MDHCASCTMVKRPGRGITGSHKATPTIKETALASTKNTTGVNQVNESIKNMGEQLENVRVMARNLEQMAQSENEFLAMFDTDNKND